MSLGKPALHASSCTQRVALQAPSFHKCSAIRLTMKHRTPVCRANSSSRTSNPYQQPIGQSPNEKRWSSNGGTGTKPSSPSSVPSSTDDTTKRVTQLSELLQETARVAIATGPRGIIRALQAAQSVSNLSVEYISRGVVDPPQVRLTCHPKRS